MKLMCDFKWNATLQYIMQKSQPNGVLKISIGTTGDVISAAHQYYEY